MISFSQFPLVFPFRTLDLLIVRCRVIEERNHQRNNTAFSQNLSTHICLYWKKPISTEYNEFSKRNTALWSFRTLCDDITKLLERVNRSHKKALDFSKAVLESRRKWRNCLTFWEEIISNLAFIPNLEFILTTNNKIWNWRHFLTSQRLFPWMLSQITW